MLVAIIALYFHQFEASGVYSTDLLRMYGLVIPVKMQFWMFGAFALAFAFKVPRITSYNVCYTKLLREALLTQVPFVAQVGTNEGPVFRAAHAVLPSASFAEQGGTWTNYAGRVQRFWMAFPPRGKARAGIEILNGLAAQLGGEWNFTGEGPVFRALAESCPPFAGMSYESIGSGGRVAGETP